MKRILVVEDNAELAKLLELILRRAGYEIAVAVDGFDALRQFEVQQPELVLLDIMLPNLDGYEVCDRIRHELNSDVPVVMLSSLDSYLDMERSRQVGATDHIAKPFDKDVLLKVIEKYTGTTAR
jgi:twitching motility two-component system response regulator PilG